MERKQGFFSALKDEVVRGLSPGKSRSRSPARSGSAMTGLLRRRKGHHVAIPEVLIARSGSLRPPEMLSPLREGPDQCSSREEREEGGWAHWMKRNPSVSGSSSSSSSAACKRSDLRLLLGVLGAPLAPVHVSATEPLPHLSIKDTPIETSSAQYILQQYTAASGGLKLQNSIHNAYAMGKLKMLASDIETPNKVIKNRNSSKSAESGGFVLWQMNPDMWYVITMAATCNTQTTLFLKTPFTPTKTHQQTHFLPFNFKIRTPISKITCTAATTTTPTTKSPANHRSEDRVFNFAAGPAVLPENVLQKAQSELLNWRGSGMSVMEMSHRGKEFTSIIEKAEADLRTLLNIPSDYTVLFLQGGASTQFSAIPLNLCNSDDAVDYLVTGSWGDKAAKEAVKYAKSSTIWSGKSDNYTRIPNFDGSEFEQNSHARYLHICANETIYGVEFKDYPVPANPNGFLVADMSSNFCSKPVDVTKFGLIYAGAQKNVGPSGVTIVIVRNDLIGKAQKITPIMLDYKIHADNKSLYNTPPCYGIYMCGLVFEDLLNQGGLVEVEKKNKAKAQVLYDAIDESNGFYKCPVEKSVRSLMNVPFTLEKSELEPEFIKEAAKEKMVALKGHRSVGGMRASIYNAMPLAGVQKLVAFMKEFQAKHA